jgi:hypothetical protein
MAANAAPVHDLKGARQAHVDFDAFARLFFAFASSLFARPRRSIAMPFVGLGLPDVDRLQLSDFLLQCLQVAILRHEAKADQPILSTASV